VKLNLANLWCNTLALALVKFFSGEISRYTSVVAKEKFVNIKSIAGTLLLLRINQEAIKTVSMLQW